MKTFKAKIFKLNIASVRVYLDTTEITDEAIVKNCQGSETLICPWLQNYTKASMKFHKSIADTVITLVNDKVIIGVDQGVIVDITPYKTAPECCRCRRLYFSSDMVSMTRVITTNKWDNNPKSHFDVYDALICTKCKDTAAISTMSREKLDNTLASICSNEELKHKDYSAFIQLDNSI